MTNLMMFLVAINLLIIVCWVWLFERKFEEHARQVVECLAALDKELDEIK